MDWYKANKHSHKHTIEKSNIYISHHMVYFVSEFQIP